MVSSVTNNTSGAAAAGQGTKGIAKNFDQFLFLLTQQLKNQDPLEPMDTSQFTQQLVQFANVEQSIKMNENMNSLIQLQTSNANTAMLNYIGKEVEAVGDNLPLKDGEAKFKYALPEKATTVSIKILDKAGKLVRELSGSGEAGAHDLVWDGKDNNGATAPNGTYKLEVSASKMVNGTPQKLDTFTAIVGQVSAVKTDPSQPGVMIGDVLFPLANIVTVRTVEKAS